MLAAIIPARGGSKRIQGKNMKPLHGIPLFIHSINLAIQSELFDKVYVSSENDQVLELGKAYGAIPLKRTMGYSDDSTDYEWIVEALETLGPCDIMLLRPTNPFRTHDTLSRAIIKYYRTKCDSLRSFSKSTSHPYKSGWAIKGDYIEPMHPLKNYHNEPTQGLPVFYKQNAAIEMFNSETLIRFGNVSGELIVPFIMEDYEGHDINKDMDWKTAELLINEGLVKLPEILERRYGQ